MPRWVRSWAASPSTTWPSKRTVPVSLCSVPHMQLTSVDLPEPFGPIRPTRSPGCDRQVDAVERDEAAEALAEILDVEQRLGHQRAPGRMLAKIASRERHVGRAVVGGAARA